MTLTVGDVVDYGEFQWQVIACELVSNRGGSQLPPDPIVTLERYEPALKGRGRRHQIKADARYCLLVGRQLSLMEESLAKRDPVERPTRAYLG